MGLEGESVGSVTILRNIGDIRQPAFRAEIEDLVEQRHRQIVLDIETLSLHSVTFALLIRWRREFIDRGGDLVLVKPSDPVRKALASLGLLDQLTVNDHEATGAEPLHRESARPSWST